MSSEQWKKQIYSEMNDAINRGLRHVFVDTPSLSSCQLAELRDAVDELRAIGKFHIDTSPKPWGIWIVLPIVDAHDSEPFFDAVLPDAHSDSQAQLLAKWRHCALARVKLQMRYHSDGVKLSGEIEAPDGVLIDAMRRHGMSVEECKEGYAITLCISS